MIEVVGIDVDDTLCMTEAASYDIENEALRRIGRAPMSRELHVATWGHVLSTAIQERSPGVDVGEFHAAYHPVLEEFIAAGSLDDIPNENYAALDELIARGKKIALLTSRTHSELKHMLEPTHLLANRVSGFYYKETMRHQKPHAQAFTELLRDFALRPSACVYIGDSPGDAAASNGAGVHFIASLESGVRKPEDFAPYNVASYITRFPEIVEVVATLDGR